MRLAALLAPLLLAAPAAAERPDPRARLDRLLAGRVAGPPQACLPAFGRIRTEVIPGYAIVYRANGRIWVNRPRGGAEWLTRDSILVQRTPLNRFCRTDPVRLLDRGSRFERGFVVLGDFVPYLPTRRS